MTDGEQPTPAGDAGGADLDIPPDDTADAYRRQLEELQRQVDDLVARRTWFLSAAAHELKSPLTILQVYLETLLGDLSEGMTSEQLEFLQICHDSLLRLRHMVLDLVDVGALESGELDLTTGPVEVPPLLEAVRQEMAPLARHSNVTLTVSSPPQLPIARANADRVRQVVRNLVGNAVHHTPAGGVVTIRGVARDGMPAVLVADTGVGIPANRLEDIFEEYVRGDGHLHGRGSGLGLAVCRRIVDALGGSISVTSTVGEGSVFTVTLAPWQEG